MDSQPEKVYVFDLCSCTDVGSKSSFMPKPDLESLGFVINNGKPRFKLDEPTSTNFYPQIELSKTDCSLDDSDTLSFVVLGKKSLESVQASSLATYTDIQRKCMSIDYNSIISSLNSSEIQQKLTELLQENVKLKETLKQNTTAMKQQFNTLAMWQEKVMNVHKHHKQKFTETRQLISLLKQENAELKWKLHTLNTDDAMHATTTKTDNSVHFNQLQEKVSSLSNELNNLKFNCVKLREDVKKCIHVSNIMDTRLIETTQVKEEQDLKILETEAITDHFQIKELCELSNSLENEIKTVRTSINVNMEQMSDQQISSQSHYSVQSVKQYGEMLQELTDCFIKQMTCYSAIQECIKTCINILHACESIKLPEKYNTIEDNWSLQLDQIQIYKEKLSICQKRLLEEQLKLVTDKRSFIKIQNQFHKIFSDYNSILFELEIMSTENSKLQVMKDTISKVSSQRITELESHNHENEEKYKEIKDVLERERQSWNEQKKSLDNQRKSLNMEYKSLLEQKEIMVSLQDEKTLVSKQCELHENNEKILQAEKGILENNNKQLIANVNTLRNELAEKNNALKKLAIMKEEQDRLLKQQVEEIELLKTQLLCYEEDFQSERTAKEKLLLEKSQLREKLINACVKTFCNKDSELN